MGVGRPVSTWCGRVAARADGRGLAPHDNNRPDQHTANTHAWGLRESAVQSSDCVGTCGGERKHLVPANTREVGGERAGQAVLWGMHMQEEGVNPASGYTQDSALAVCRA